MFDFSFSLTCGRNLFFCREQISIFIALLLKKIYDESWEIWPKVSKTLKNKYEKLCEGGSIMKIFLNPIKWFYMLYMSDLRLFEFSLSLTPDTRNLIFDRENIGFSYASILRRIYDKSWEIWQKISNIFKTKKNIYLKIILHTPTHFSLLWCRLR